MKAYESAGNMEMADNLRYLLEMANLVYWGRNSGLDNNFVNDHGKVRDITESLMPEMEAAQQYADDNPIVVPVVVQFNGNVTGNRGGGSGFMNSLSDAVYSGIGSKFYAEGGRASEASIFGEAGPEWAIPEEHSNRTAMLLNEARAASGFTWAELLARSGGLNADANRTPTTVIYSPTINAGDASGVEEALMRDKALLEKWWKGMNARERMVSFA